MTHLRHILLLACLTSVGGSRVAAQHPTPRLGVVIVVDQMRADAITRLGGLYTQGLAELLRTGVVFSNAHQDHAVTATAVGHATIATGVFPRRHGVVGNSWYDRSAQRAVYASEDSSVKILGQPLMPGRSPRQLRVPTVGDWIKKASPRSRVVAVALKDRAATFMGGLQGDGAYWYSEDAGRYVTSTYYRSDSLPWLDAFNTSGRLEAFFVDGWAEAFAEEMYLGAREDSFPTEADGVHVKFPHEFSGDSTGPVLAYYSELRVSPFGDELTFDVARLLVQHDSLGVDDAPDLLFIGCSAADYIGHTFGPLSMEAADYYLQLDAMIGEFLRFLDLRLGPDGYFVVLTSDHGVLPLPEDLKRRGFPAERFTGEDLQFYLEQSVMGGLQESGLEVVPRVRLVNGLFFDFQENGVDKEQVARLLATIAERIREAPFIGDVYTRDELQGTGGDRPFLDLFRRQFPDDLMPDMAFRFVPLSLVAWGDYGTTHGSPYGYDTHIPLVFRGPGITPSRHDRRVRSVDIAPTLSFLLGIDPPAHLDGEVLREVVSHR